MALEFPNNSRHFDDKHGRVAFWGYDGALEITFFIDAEALMTLDPCASGTECSLLGTFDRMRERVEQVAIKAYRRTHRRTFCFSLVARDFRRRPAG